MNPENEPLLLSIDCGTQSIRALLFSLRGNLLAMKKITYEPYFSTKPGWAEQDPGVFRDGMCAAIKALKAESSALFGRIAAVGVTTQRDTMINVDRDGIPLRPATTWLDQRKAHAMYKPKGLMKFAYRLVGMDESILKTQIDGKVNWIMQNQPEIWEKTYKYLQVSGFLNHFLTGDFMDSIASQIGHIPFNYKKMAWSRPGDLNYQLFPVPREKLPDLVQPGEIIGKVTKSAAELTGLPEGLFVVAAGSDKGCETIGSGVIDPSRASLSFGTTATIQTTSAKYFEPLAFMPAYPAPIKGHFNPEVEIFRGYWLITWFKAELGHSEVKKAAEEGTAPEVVLNRLLAETPPGCMGLMLQPFWSPGLKNPSAKGAMIGFGDVHKRAHIYRAVVEGLAYALFDGHKSMEKAGKCSINEVTVSGGASQSDEICQISADIFNLPLYRGRTTENSGLGAAIVGSVGAGLFPDVKSAVKEMVHHEKTFEPDQANAKLYRELYERVYSKMYTSLGPLYREIREITGYPENPAEE